MAGELLIFDAAGSNIDGTDPGSALNIGPGTSYAIRAFSAPAPPQTIQYAGSADTEGSLPSSRKHENRIISVTVLCSTAAALRTLEGKVGKVAREGGTLKWVLPNAETIIFDLHSADTFEPTIDKMLYVRAGAFCEVQMTFVAKPYGRGAEVDLGDNTETTLPLLVFTDAGIKGDMPGLGRLVIDNDDASEVQYHMRWGIQSRYYSNASTAALFYQAESCALLAASVATGPSGASGGVSNNSVFYGSVVGGGAYSPLIYIGASSTAQTHVGAFQVYARALVSSGSVGVISLRAEWQPTLGGPIIDNPAVPIVDGYGVSIEDEWVLVDLGQISIPPAKAGNQGWIGTIQAGSTLSGDDIYLDWVMLVPILEGSGGFDKAGVDALGSVQVRHNGVLVSYTGGYYTESPKYSGDYLFIPPSGAESRTLRVIVKMSRGDPTGGSLSDGLAGTGIIWDPGTDDLSARLFYTPRWLVVPEL